MTKKGKAIILENGISGGYNGLETAKILIDLDDWLKIARNGKWE